MTNTENGDDDAPEERARRRWDEVGAALQRANVLGQRWDEVADALPFEIRLAVELVDRRLVGGSVGTQPHEADRGRLDKMDAG